MESLHEKVFGCYRDIDEVQFFHGIVCWPISIYAGKMDIGIVIEVAVKASLEELGESL